MQFSSPHPSIGLFFFVMLGISGCADVQGAYKSYKETEEITYVNDAKKSCERYGFKVDTDAFAQCVNTNVNASKDRDALIKAAFYADKK